MSPFPNYFRNRSPWLDIRFGGRLVKAALVEINGIATKDEWKKQKSKETSGQVNVFAGTTWSDPKFTFEAVDAGDFDDLRRLWELLAPVPGLGGTSLPAGVPSGYVSGGPVGSPPASNAAASGTVGVAVGGKTGSKDGWPGGPGIPDPGPRPPTVTVQYPPLAWHGITAVARASWEGPIFTATGSIRHIITFVAEKPPKLAGAGAMTPAKDIGSQYATAGGTPPADGAATPTPQAQVNKNARAGAAGT